MPYPEQISWQELPVSGGGGVYLSTNNGTSWALFNTGLTNNAVEAVAAYGTNLFAGTLTGIDRSTDNGISWDAVDSQVVSLHDVCTFALVNTTLFASSFGGGVYRSTDDGATWTAMNDGLPDTWIRSLATFGSSIFAASVINGVFLSTNNGVNWSSVNTGLMNTDVQTLVVAGADLIAGTAGNGAWKRPLSEMTAVLQTGENMPARFSLSQNYPNPFNPATVINYQLAENTLVTLKVYDELGRLLRTLVEARQSAGIHSVTFNASSLSSGVYYYRLTAGSFVQTKKLMLLK